MVYQRVFIKFHPSHLLILLQTHEAHISTALRRKLLCKLSAVKSLLLDVKWVLCDGNLRNRLGRDHCVNPTCIQTSLCEQEHLGLSLRGLPFGLPLEPQNRYAQVKDNITCLRPPARSMCALKGRAGDSALMQHVGVLLFGIA